MDYSPFSPSSSRVMFVAFGHQGVGLIYNFYFILLFFIAHLIFWYFRGSIFTPRSPEVEPWVFRWTFSSPSPSYPSPHHQLWELGGTVLYCTAYCTVLYCIVLYCTVLYCIVLYCTVLYCIVLYCTVLYCIVLYCTVLYCIVFYCIVLYCTVLYCTVLYCTVKKNPTPPKKIPLPKKITPTPEKKIPPKK